MERKRDAQQIKMSKKYENLVWESELEKILLAFSSICVWICGAFPDFA